MRDQAALLMRFANVREFMVVVRKVDNYAAVFTAVNPALDSYIKRMYKVWTGVARLEPSDAPMITEMEKVVAQLKAA